MNARAIINQKGIGKELLLMISK